MPHSPIRSWRRSALAAGLASALAVGSGLPLAQAVGPDAPVQAPAVQAPQQSFADLVEAVQPAVVSIVVEARRERTAAAGLQLPEDPRLREFFERFFENQPDTGQPPVQGAGSGFIIDAQGYVVTNHHVVDGAQEITVILDDGSRHQATLRGSDAKTDLALLKIDTDERLPWVDLGESDSVRVGDWVVAIGNPFGLGGTVTTGIVSARGRNINSGPYDDYLQIDAPINRGNSGGPLFDLNGKVVGVNTAIFSPNGGNVGIGFAIPSAQARSVIEALKQSGQVERGWLGVQIQPLTEELAEALDLPDRRGALVAAVTPDSPAQEAGIRTGDVIVGFNDEALEEMRDLPRQVAAVSPGSTATVELLREGKRKRVQVTLAATEQTAALDDRDMPAEDDARLGLALAPLDDGTRNRYAVPEELRSGALVVQVQPQSTAAEAGLRPGDVIVQANGDAVQSPEDVSRAVKDTEDGRRLVLLVNRQGNQWFVPVTVAQG